jgi:ADP-heptose:LPS heptosyltransferase
MFLRFLPVVCNKNKRNKILILINDKLVWIVKKSFYNLNNLDIIPFSKKSSISNYHYDYHCNIIMLIKFLGYKYDNIIFNPFLKDIDSYVNQKNKNIILEKEKLENTKFIVFNWHGNYNNSHEKYNRGMNIEYAIPLFKLKNIKWFVVTKDISNIEFQILNKYDVNVLNFDNGDNAFEDTISLFKQVDYVISTDTSLLHISGSMDVPSIALLTLGCEWRWCSNDENTKWYPNMKLIKQKKYGDWESVINNVIDLLK